MKKVLLTGATGFIGSHCIEPLLQRGYEVHAVAGSSMPPQLKGVTWHQADLMRNARELVESVDPSHLLHLAWHVVPGQFESLQNYRWVSASMDLLTHFCGERVLMCGSGYEYDWGYGYCTESRTPLTPNTVYGSCKHALHTMARSFATQNSLSFAWGRVFFLYGPREHPDRLVSSVIRSLLKNEPAKCSHGKQFRDYMHVQDVANGLVAALDSPVQGAVNISSAHATPLRDIVQSIGEQLGKSELIRLGALPARPNDTPLVIGDNTKLVSETGWQQTFELEAGLRHTIDWWRSVL